MPSLFNSALLVAAAATAAAWTDPVGPFLPWGVRLAYGEVPQTTMTVAWQTRQEVSSSVAEVGTAAGSYQWSFTGNASFFIAALNNTQWTHIAHITDLPQAGAVYHYRVGDGAGNWSSDFTFRTQPSDPASWQPSLVIYGDMGVDVNAHKTLPRLYQDVAAGAFDVLLHIGDAAYDLDSNYGANGDEFLVNIEPISAGLPYHLTPGNHETALDFYAYRNLFDYMPNNNGSQSMYHSFNVGLAHVVMISSEVYFNVLPHGLGLLPQMYAWLEADLAAVDRSVTPWIITGEHRPIYCSANDDNDECHTVSNFIRAGIAGQYGVEELLYRYGVEVNFAAHEHSYERNYPVYNYTWNASLPADQQYIDFDRTVHILTGAAGCPENEDPWQPANASNPFSAVRINDYGYGYLRILNATHLVWEYRDDETGAILDSVTLVKHSHGPFDAASAMQGPGLVTEELARSPRADGEGFKLSKKLTEGRHGASHIDAATLRHLSARK